MPSRSVICSAFLIHLFGASCAYGIWHRTESVEWKTDVADIVAIAIVTDTQAMEPYSTWGSTIWDSQQVDCRIVELIKGDWHDDVSFRQDFRNPDNPSLDNALCIKNGDRILVFLSISQRRVAVKTIDWFNLSSPIPILETRPTFDAPYDNDGNGLANEAAIMKVVRSRASQRLPLKRGLIVYFPFLPREECRGYSHDFVITAEPKYKQRFIDLLQSEYDHIRTAAIYNLASYPGKESERLLRAMLDDPAQETSDSHKQGTRILTTYYPVRQAAYEALLLLDADVEPPEPYYPELSSTWLQRVGFENETYFPRQEWWVDWNPSHFFGAWLAPHIFLAILPPFMLLIHKRHWRLTIRDLLLGITGISILLGMCARAFGIMSAGNNVYGDLINWFTSSSDTLLPVFFISASIVASFCLFSRLRGKLLRCIWF